MALIEISTTSYVSVRQTITHSTWLPAHIGATPSLDRQRICLYCLYAGRHLTTGVYPIPCVRSPIREEDVLVVKCLHEAFYDRGSPHFFWGSSREELYISPEDGLRAKSICIRKNPALDPIIPKRVFRTNIRIATTLG